MQLSFDANNSLGNSACADIQILNDNILEFDEIFTVTLSALDDTFTISNASSSTMIVILEDSNDCKFQLPLQCFLVISKPNQYFIETQSACLNPTLPVRSC